MDGKVYTHFLRGGRYRVIKTVSIQGNLRDGETAVLYENEEGHTFVRSPEHFYGELPGPGGMMVKRFREVEHE